MTSLIAETLNGSAHGLVQRRSIPGPQASSELAKSLLTLLRTWRSLLVCALLAFTLPVEAQLTIRITQGIEGAQPIAIVPFGWQDAAQPLSTDVAEVIASDLARSGHFAPVAFDALPSRPDQSSDVNFADWRLLGTGNLVIGRVTPTEGGRYAVQFRLFDVFRGTQMTGFQYEVSGADLRRTAHQIADVVYEQLTGERGAFATRVAYVTDTGTDGPRRYGLNVADSDGFDARPVLQSPEPIMSPEWSPDGRKLAYVSFESGRSRVYVQDLFSGARDEIAGFPGINSAPAWSPDGRHIALVLSKDGNAELYLYEVGSRRLIRLTSNSAIDTEPSWSPDGTTLAFTSDRGGRPQIYTMPAFGGEATRLTFEGDYNARPEFSPDGKKLALVHSVRGSLRIALLDLDNNALTLLTDGNLDESPSFAPNGSMILYATVAGGEPTLAAVSSDGRVRQRLSATEGEVREPAWSPFGRPRPD